MNSCMHLRYWSSVGLLPARGPGWPGGASASRISSAMRARRSLGEVRDETCPFPQRLPPPEPHPQGPRPRSQSDDVCVCLLDRDAQRVLLLVIQGMLVSSPLQEQADLTEGWRGQVGAGPGRAKATPGPRPRAAAGRRGAGDSPRPSQECGVMQGRPAPAVSLVHVRSVLQKEFTDNQGALGSQGQFRLTWKWPLLGLQEDPRGARVRAIRKGALKRHLCPAQLPPPPPRLLTPSTACTNGVLPSSSASAQLTSAPCASAVASAGRSRVRAAR